MVETTTRPPSPTGDEVRFVAGIFSLIVFLGGSAGWSVKWPPGIGLDWFFFAVLTVLALILDTWWLLRTPGWQKLLALLMLLMAIGSFAGLAGAYGESWSHGQRF